MPFYFKCSDIILGIILVYVYFSYLNGSLHEIKAKVETLPTSKAATWLWNKCSVFGACKYKDISVQCSLHVCVLQIEKQNWTCDN